MTGAQEVPARDTQAQGQAIFHLSDDGQSIDYKLIATNIDNVVQAHIHLGSGRRQRHHRRLPLRAGSARPVGGTTASWRRGRSRRANLIGPISPAQPLGDLVDAMRSGNAYVNVHTNDGVAPTEHGPR